MAVFEVTQDRLVELKVSTFSHHGFRERADLQRLLRAQVEIVAPETLVVSEEFCDWQDSRRRIDLLGVDKSGALVVIELKRTEDGGHMELQALRYAAMVSQMTFEKVTEVFGRYLTATGQSVDARQTLLDFLEWDASNEDRFAQDVRVVLVSAEFSKELTSTVLWLNEQGLDIRCVRMRPHSDGARLFVDVQQVLPLPEASDYFVSLREKQTEAREARRREEPWSGLWFVNVGMDEGDDVPADEQGRGRSRNWSNCVRLGYIAAGGGARYSGALRKLGAGAPIVAYQKGAGYLGYGIVTGPAEPAHLLRMPDGRRLADALNCPDINDGPEDRWEYALPVNWRRHVAMEHAKTFKGVFANQNIVCKLSHPETVRFVRDAFAIPVDVDSTVSD